MSETVEIKDVRGDFRWLLDFVALAGATVAGGLGLLGAIAKGFHWV